MAYFIIGIAVHIAKVYNTWIGKLTTLIANVNDMIHVTQSVSMLPWYLSGSLYT